MNHVQQMILDQIVHELSNEPPHDAGSHPSIEVHERVGAKWAEWDKRISAWKLVLGGMLVKDAIEEHLKAVEK